MVTSPCFRTNYPRHPACNVTGTKREIEITGTFGATNKCSKTVVQPAKVMVFDDAYQNALPVIGMRSARKSIVGIEVISDNKGWFEFSYYNETYVCVCVWEGGEASVFALYDKSHGQLSIAKQYINFRHADTKMC